jgi:hypothetical protein
MESNYGKQMGNAIQAVLDMQDDCIRLFHDLDKALPEYRSLYGNVVTWDIASSITRRQYFAKNLIRLYVRAGREEQALGINICFYDDEKLEEPIFVAANTRYRTIPPSEKEKNARGWDPGSAFLKWTEARAYRMRVTIKNPSKRSEIEQAIVAAAPLYSITTVESALQIIDLVGRP